MTRASFVLAVVAFSLQLIVPGGEAREEGIESALRRAAASGQVPADLVVVYDDMHGLHGGTTIELRGEGTARRTDRLKDQAAPRAKETRVHQKKLAELVQKLVSIEAWKQKTPTRLARADESEAKLQITIGGRVGGFWEWYNDLEQNARLSRIKGRLDYLVPQTDDRLQTIRGLVEVHQLQCLVAPCPSPIARLVVPDGEARLILTGEASEGLVELDGKRVEILGAFATTDRDLFEVKSFRSLPKR